jgi:thiamine transport system substrate-binding protein
MTTRILAPLALLLLAVPLLAGCAQAPAATAAKSYADLGFQGYPTGKDASKWPDLTGQTVTILDQGAFDYLYSAAKPLFENLTHAKLAHIAAADAGDTLQRALREAGDPSYDVVYGIDNVLLWKAAQADVFLPYKPVHAGRIDPALVFFDAQGPWYATPADHGYIGINADPRAANVTSLRDLVPHAKQFVTEDPRTSSPGLGFLLATVATFGDTGTSSYDYLHYWDDLFTHGVLVTPDWTAAYVQHFSAGYGAPEAGGKGLADRPIVTSYTTSPAYEAFSGSKVAGKALVEPKSTFHQVETMGIARGTKHLAAAQAWVEFTLTDAYQALQAPQNAVYPVVTGIDVAGTYAHADPAPGSFEDAGFTYAQTGANVERWVREWTDLYERRHA